MRTARCSRASILVNFSALDIFCGSCNCNMNVITRWLLTLTRWACRSSECWRMGNVFDLLAVVWTSVPLIFELRLQLLRRHLLGFLGSTCDLVPAFHRFLRAAVFLHAPTEICVFSNRSAQLEACFSVFLGSDALRFDVLCILSGFGDPARPLVIFFATANHLG